MSSLLKISLVASTLLLATSVHADGEKKKRFSESQYRHDVMEVPKYTLAGMVQHLKGELDLTEELPALAQMMATAASISKASFEKDTRGMEGHTEAKDSIWENWEDFAARMDTFEADTKALVIAAESGDKGQFGAAFGKVTKNCKSCHDKYRD